MSSDRRRAGRKSPATVLLIAALTAAAALVPAAAASADSPQDPTATPTAWPSGNLLPAPPLVVPTPVIPATTAVWVNDTLRVVYSSAGPFFTSTSEYEIGLFVDGKRVGAEEPGGFKDRVVAVPRAASAGPALVELRSFALVERGSFDDVYPTTYFTATVHRQVVTAKRGQVSASTLLDLLTVAPEHHSNSFRPSRFGRSRDADHDGEHTRTEVLKAESAMKVVLRRHVAQTGSWTSPYDDARITRASRLVIDHLVPLREAWTSGAAEWAAQRREAYRNDIAFAPSLAAVTKEAAHTKRERDPSGYLPSAEGSRCRYVRNWIAVKYRWSLTVDKAEKAVLATDLAKYCINPSVTKPRKPDISALVE